MEGSVLLRLQFLGTGTSFGVPQIGCDCAVCKSVDPRDRRLRSSLWVQGESTSIVIDTTPDFRQQCLTANILQLDAILFTHYHADHFFGLDDARVFNRIQKCAIPIYLPEFMVEHFHSVYGYSLKEPMFGLTVPRFELHPLSQTAPPVLTFDELTITPVLVNHGYLDINGYIIETALSKVAYLTDCKSLPPATVDVVKGADIVILGALWNRDWQHPGHLNLADALTLASQLGGKRTYLTHLTHNMDLHAETGQALPDGVMLAYDQLSIDLK